VYAGGAARICPNAGMLKGVGVDRKKRRRRQRRLDAAVAAIHRRYGPRALFQGKPVGAAAEGSPVPHVSTGCPALDEALGIGGLPRGTVCELVGPATPGKTTLALKFLAQAQAGGGQAAYIDQALYFDPDYAHRCAVDLSRLVVGTTHDLDEALAATEALARSGGLAALVFDAFDFLWTDAQAAARLEATLNRLPVVLARSGTILLVLHESSGGTSPALSALAHYAAVRLRVVRERWLEHRGDVRGYAARVEVLKNRAAPGPLPGAVTITIEFNGTVRGKGL
jgi:recombination protein RecA